MEKNFLSLAKICDVVSKYSLYVLVALIPIFFLPFTGDFLDFNKQAILILLTSISLFSWIISVLVSGKLSFNLSKTNIAVAIFFLIAMISVIFSKDKYQSFWGYQTPVTESLLTVIGLCIFYFLVSNIFSKKEIVRSIYIFVSSALLSVLLGIIYLLGLFILPFNFAKSTSFNTIGSLSSFGFFVTALLPLLIILEVFAKKWMKIVFAVGIAFCIISLVFINYFLIWWMVLVGCILVTVFAAIRRKTFDLRWLSIAMFFIVISLFFLILQPSFVFVNRPTEIYLNQASTLDVAIKTIKSSPLLGSGPGTFVFDFSKFKKVDFNQSQIWNLSFDAGASKFLTNFATTGILGVLSFLAIILVVIFYGVKNILSQISNSKIEDKNNYWLISGGVLASFTTISIGYLILNSSLSLDFMFFFLMACFISLTFDRKDYELSPSSLLTLSTTFLFTLFFIFGLGLLILGGQRYVAEIRYYNGVKALSLNQTDKAISSLESAVALNPSMDFYFNQLAQVYILKISEVVADKKLSETDKSKNVQLLISNAINASKIATDISPNNVNNWASRALIYQNLIGTVPGAEDWAITSNETAMKLDPQNPYYLTQKGINLMAKASLLEKDKTDEKNKNYEAAKVEFDKAIKLKSDYSLARFQLAMLYQAQGKTDQVMPALLETEKYAPDDVGLAFQIGVLYYEDKKYDEAQVKLEKALFINPNYSNALYYLALTYYKLDSVDKAIEQMAAVLKLNPDNEQIKKALDNLKNGKNPLEEISAQNPPQAPVQEGSPVTNTKK